MAASKKGVSAHQLHRMLAITYKSTWFMAHRIREAMRDDVSSPIGGDEKIVEADETFVGGKARNAKKGKPIPKKYPVVALVERGGKLRARRVADVTAKNVRKVLVTQASRKSMLMTDDALIYERIGKEFYAHAKVTHSKGEYTDAIGFAHTNTVESFFALLKRGVFGVFHAVSEQHLQRYADEFAFRWNQRKVDDTERTNAAIQGAAGKRLTYRPSNQA